MSARELKQAVSGAALTDLQRATLQRLADLDRFNDLVGFNPCSFGGERAAASARGMARRGWVSLSRVSERHVRYAITVAGLEALGPSARDTAERQPNPREDK